MLPFDVFFALLAALTAVDVWSTAKGLRGGASEANPVARSLIKALGVPGALLLVKALYLYFVWTNPPTDPAGQWISLALFTAVAANNLRVLRKTGAL